MRWPASIVVTPAAQLREATTQYGVDGYIRRAQLAEERAGRLEDKNEQLTTEAERLRSRLEAAENTLARQEALRLKDEADDLGLRLRRDLERTADELQRCAARPTARVY